MKVVLAITSSEGAEDIADVLKERGFRVTLMSSMGGFLRRRSTTMMIGVADEQVEDVLQIIREHAPPPPAPGRRLLGPQPEGQPAAVAVFVLDMARMEQFQP